MNNSFFKAAVLTAVLGLFLWGGAARPAFAQQLTFNLVAVNASDQAKKIEVRTPLPKELQPNDILDTGSLKLGYDVDKGTYYVHGTVQFAPHQTKTFSVKVKDVWRIQKQEIDIVKQLLDENLKNLKKDKTFKDYAAAKEAHDQLIERLDFIYSQQQHYSDDIERRIEQYRAYHAELQNIAQNAYDLNYLKTKAETLNNITNADTVTLVIDVKNPSDTETRTIEHRHYLPKEVRAEDILDKQGFEVRYDEAKHCAYLVKKDTFKPGEEKQYKVVIRNVWKFPVPQLDSAEKRANIAIKELKGSMYAESGQYLFDQIQSLSALIKDSQGKKLPVSQEIGLFRVNETRYRQLDQDLKQLEQMMAIIRAQRLAKLQNAKVKNVLQRLKALRGLRALSQAIFKKGISITLTWRIIFGAIIVVGGFTTVHFFLWARRSKVMGEEYRRVEEIKTVPKPGEEGSEEGEEEKKA